MSEARDIFDRAAANTRDRSPATFDQWFGGIQFDDLTEGVLTLRAQNEFVMDWVKTNFLPEIVAQIREISGWAVQVNWILDANLADPVSRGKVGEPVRPRPLSLTDTSADGGGDRTGEETAVNEDIISRAESSDRAPASRRMRCPTRSCSSPGGSPRCSFAMRFIDRTSSTPGSRGATRCAPDRSGSRPCGVAWPTTSERRTPVAGSAP